MVREKENKNTKRITHCKKPNNLMSMISYVVKRNRVIDSIRQTARKISPLDSIRHTANKVMPRKPRTYTPENIITWRHGAGRQIDTYTKKSAVRSLLGCVMIGCGVVTLPLPTGSIFLIMFGAGLLGYDAKVLFSRMKYELNLLKLRRFA